MVLKRMSLILSIVFLLSIIPDRLNAQFSYMGTWNSIGVPDYLMANGDSITPDYMLALNITLPESYSVPLYNPQYIANGFDTETFCIDTTEVYVTYFDEGATFLNTLGYFTYPIGNPPSSISHSDITVIFPNASEYSGGGMLAGDKVYVGTFMPGTAIGWVIIADGFDTPSSTVQLKPERSIFYSQYQWNPEPDTSIRKHNVVFKDTLNEVYVVGFEDIRRDSLTHPYGGCDNDFNDVVFLVSASSWSAIDTGNYNPFPGPSGGVTGGGGSGVESNGTLAQHIALRDFTRLKNDDQIDFNDKTQLPLLSKFKENMIVNSNKPVGDDLLNFIPDSSVANSVAYVSSPVDLLGITNAKEIFAADYYAGNTRIGALLATETENEVYEHTKVICDRLAGATLIDIKHITIDGHPFIQYKLEQPNGEIEYGTGFTAYVDNFNYEIDNHWTINEYQSRPLNYNFQVWTSTEAMTRVLMTQVLLLMKDYGNLNYLNTNAAPIPEVYIKTGRYEGGEITLEIQNNASATELVFTGTSTASETSQREDVYFVETLSGQVTENISLNTGGIFDIGLELQSNASSGFDIVYFADGTWGLDYTDNGANITYFEVFPETDLSLPNAQYMNIERDISVEGLLNSYISVYREIPATADLTEYNTVEFKALGSDRQVMITLVDPDIDLWKDQFKAYVNIDQNSQTFEIPFNTFTSTTGASLDPENIVTIVFTLTGDGMTWDNFEFELNDLRFTDGATAINEMTADNNMSVYPNPFNNNTNIYFNIEEAANVNILVHDITGSVVHSHEQQYQPGNHYYRFNKGSLESGVYVCEVIYGDQKMKTKMIIQ